MPQPPEQDYNLYLTTRDPFDPNKLERPPEQRDSTWYIVQFKKPLTFVERNRLCEIYGLRLSDYLPNLSYLELLTPEKWQSLSTDELYRASLLYQPSYKISPDIAEFSDPGADSERRLRAVLFPGANPDKFIDALFALFTSAEAGDLAADKFDTTQFDLINDRPVGGHFQVVFPFVLREDLLGLAGLPEVRWIEVDADINVDCALQIEQTPGGLVQSGAMGNTPIWDKGIQGQGQVIGITDSSINIEHCMFFDAVAVGLDHRKVRGQRQLSFDEHEPHGQRVAALAAGHDPGDTVQRNRGMAWQAKLSLDDLDKLSGRRISLMNALANQDTDGAFIHSNSWHKAAGYTQLASDADTFVWEHEEHLVCGSSGNTGEHRIGGPGSAKNVLCVSASRNHPNHMQLGDGLPGPVNKKDLRLKPDICAPGCRITTAGAVGCERANIGCASSWATPIIAGAAALVRQYYSEGWFPTGAKRAEDKMAHPSAALVKATLLNSTVDMEGVKGYPNYREGWGRVLLTNTLFFAEEGAPKLFVRDISNTAGLRTHESHTYKVTVRDNSRPLKITLVWSDSPGLALAARPLVNNLDLIVTSPDEKTFLGNQIGKDGISVEGGAPDDINNVEMVIRDRKLQGDWIITVFCEAANGRTGTQGYALVITGALG